ncbi:MAG: aminopeptidase P N-terminal domain-containing protein [Planctomycetes bacterium]|nr:aminopeptidase P N-terminal domain-containing protein [Planctomycetota bacterium]
MKAPRRKLAALASTLVVATLVARGQDATPEAPEAPDVALARAAFDPARLKARRAALLALLPPRAVVVVAAGPRGPDTFPFRPRPDFLYLSGRREAGLTLVIAEDQDVLFAPPRDQHHELWNGPRIAPGTAIAKASGFGEVAPWGDRNDRLAALLKGGDRPLFVSGVEPADLGLPAGTPSRGAGPFIAQLRQVKDEAELALMERAIGITTAALREAIKSVSPGRHEYEAQAVIEYVFARYGAQRAGFASILGSGPHSCVLHYQDNRRRMAAGDLVVMDVGAELWGYTADVSRTVPVSGRFTPRQREIYELVLRAQEAGFKAVRPGATLRQVDAAARAVIARAGHGRAFPHGTSHWLGMDVHDVGAYDRPLEPGMVLTVEPGVYLRDEAIGVRIEDDVVVTADGYRLLSGGVPRDPDELEALMAEPGLGDVEVSPVPAPAAPAPAKGEGRFF